MFKVSKSQAVRDAVLAYLDEVRRSSGDDLVRWEILTRDGGKLSIDDCYNFTRAFEELTGSKRYEGLSLLVHSGMMVRSRGRRLVRYDHFPMEESWQGVWERYANSVLPLNALESVLDRGRESYPSIASIVEKAKWDFTRKSLPVSMHATGALMLRFFAEDGYLGDYEITKPDARDVHPETVVCGLSAKGVKESSHLLYNIFKADRINPILKSYAVQLAFFITKHRASLFEGDSRKFFIDRAIRPALKDDEMFHVYTAYLALRLMDPRSAAELESDETGHYGSLEGAGDKSAQYMRATSGSLRLSLFGSVLDGLADLDDPDFRIVPFDATRPVHIFHPEKGETRVREKLDCLKGLASRRRFTQRKMWKNYFTRTSVDGEAVRQSMELMDIGDGNLYVKEGHGRIGAAILAASRGVIPPEWLNEIPANVYTTREVPVPLMRDIMTVGVELAWPDLFPGDRDVQELFAKRGGSSSGGGSGGGASGGSRYGGITEIPGERSTDVDCAYPGEDEFDSSALSMMGIETFLVPAFRPVPA